MKQKKIKIVLEYDGTDFAGWQRQPAERTVQETLESAILRITGMDIRTTAAGRTDAGVHARAQVAHFISEARLEPAQWLKALNSILPKDVRVLDAEEAPENFDARRSAKGKWYRYRIANRKTASAIDRRFEWHIPYKLDADAMAEAGAVLVGEHDFSSFRGVGCASKNPIRTVKSLNVVREPKEEIIINIVATAFLKHMVRNIVGTLVEVGRGKSNPADMKKILAAKDRKVAGPTAQPQGLTLMEVYY